MMASEIMGLPFHPQNVKTLKIGKTVDFKFPINFTGVASNDSDKSSVVTVASPASETSLSISSSSRDVTVDNSTSSASSYILREDRFDRHISRKIQLLLDNIEATLFEDLSGDCRLQNEVEEWRTTFPHLRVVGSTLVAGSEDPGFKFYKSPIHRRCEPSLLERSTNNEKSTSHVTQPNSLMVTGWPAIITEASAEQTPERDYENVIAVEGQLQEIIAIDSSRHHQSTDRAHSLKPRKSPTRLSPSICWQTNIYDLIFDDLWPQVLGFLQPVLSKCHQRRVLRRIKSATNMNTPQLLSSEKPVFENDTIAREVGKQLTGLLTISSKTLLGRDKQLDGVPSSACYRGIGLTHQSSGSLSMMLDMRPGTQTSYKQLDRLTSVRRPVSRRRQSTSINNGFFATIQENVTDLTVVRGHKLSVATDHNNQSNVLPPLQVETTKYISSFNNSGIRNAQRRHSTRTICASSEINVLPVHLEKILILTPTRPKTMQALSNTDSNVDRRSSTSFIMTSPRQPAVNMTTVIEQATHRWPKSNPQSNNADPQNVMHSEIRGTRLRRYNTIAG